METLKGSPNVNTNVVAYNEFSWTCWPTCI